MFGFVEIDVLILGIVTQAIFVLMGIIGFAQTKHMVVQDKIGRILWQITCGVFLLCGGFNLYALLFLLNPETEAALKERFAYLIGLVLG